MAIDNKYGKITFEKEPGTPIPDDEPIFVLRAQDEEAPETIIDYAKKCERAGSPQEHVNAVMEVYDTFMDWQRTHTTKVPD